MHPELDLQRSIRPGLDILANEIVIALKKRSRFPQNIAIYRPGLVVSDRAVSLLDHHLGQVERTHAELGRYLYASQDAYTDVSGVAPVIDRPAPENPIPRIASNVGARVKARYFEWVGAGCRPGTDTDTYGQTVTADVVALLAILERVNLGKYVAESKMSDEPDAFRATAGERAAIEALIVKPDREAQVIETARALARHYDFPAEEAEGWFLWMISATVDVEVDYVRARLAAEAG